MSLLKRKPVNSFGYTFPEMLDIILEREAKFDKATAEYQDLTPYPYKACGGCRMFLNESDTCLAVEGSIDEFALCGFYIDVQKQIAWEIKENLMETPSDVMVEFEFSLKKRDVIEGIVYGVVYEPSDYSNPDAHGDFAEAEVIEKFAHTFATNGMEINLQHQEDLIKGQDYHVLESYIAKDDFMMNGEPIKKGSWVLSVQFMNEDIKQAINEGRITGFSLEGAGVLEDVA